MKKIESLLLLLFVLLFASAQAEPVRLYCLNIGKADCMLLLNDGCAFLVDSGYEHTYPALETLLHACGVDRLDGVFLTHCHEDHYGGLLPLAESGTEIGAFYAPSLYFDVKTDEHPAQIAAAVRGQDIRFLEAGDRIPAGKDSAFEILGPLRVNEDNENNNSLVMKFSSPQGSILFTGDMKFEEEEDLLDLALFSPCDVLKVGHHGDDKATSSAMLDVVRPKTAIILTHTLEEPDTPAPETLARLEAAGCDVFVSQDARDAWLVTLEKGLVRVEDVRWPDLPAPAEQMQLSIDLRDERILIENQSSQPVLLNGCTLYLSKGDNILALPDAEVKPGETFSVGSLSSEEPCDFVCHQKKLFAKKNDNWAALIDSYGRILARDRVEPAP